MANNDSRERGTAAVEMVLIAPVLIVLLAAVVGAGRIVQAKSAVLAVAREAARAASDATDASSAIALARERANQVATGLGLDPSRLEISQSPNGYERGAAYLVTVSYRIQLDDLPGLGFVPGSFVVSSAHTELIDRYKSR